VPPIPAFERVHDLEDFAITPDVRRLFHQGRRPLARQLFGQGLGRNLNP